MDALKYWITAEDQYVANRPIVLTFHLMNPNSHDVWVLKWYTPLEGLRGKILTVLRDGVPLAFQGPMVKRGEPSIEQYVQIPAGQQVSEAFDLATGYELTTGATYEVAFTGELRDVRLGKSRLEQFTPEPHAMQAVGDSVKFRITPTP